MSTPVDLLLETARSGGLHHALILHGQPPAVLSAIATRVAKAVNCLNGSTGDDCLSCSRIERDIHPDIHRTEIADDRKMISIEQIRDVVAAAGLRPFEGKVKVFIVDPAEAMTTSGANAILKTLEEPAGDTLFILLTRSPDLLLPTIRSRSQVIALRPSAPRPASEIARQQSISIQQARLVADADSEEAGRENVELAVEIVEALSRFASNRDLGALLSIGTSVGAADDPVRSFGVLATVLRDLAALDPADSIHPDQVSRIRSSVPRDRLLASARATMEGGVRLHVNADARLLVERALVILAR